MTTKALFISVIVVIATALCILFIIITTSSNSDDKSHGDQQIKASGSNSEPGTVETNPNSGDKSHGDQPTKENGSNSEPGTVETNLNSGDKSREDPPAVVEKLMIDQNVGEKYKTLATEYSNNIATAFQNKFMETEDGVLRPNTSELSNFGIKLLSMYQLDNKKTEYLTIVEDVIKKMEEKLKSLGSMNKIPWKDNWYALSITYPRMLAMYEYMGNNKEIKRICHDRIVKLVPKLNKSLGHERFGHHIVLMGIPRLLTNKLNEPSQYERDIASPEFKTLQKELNKEFNTGTGVQNGIYQDYSCIHDNDVATFSAILALGGFCVDMYTWLGYESTLVDSVKKILDKTIHPNLDFIAYGLFGREPNITCKEVLDTHWPNYIRNKNFDVNIFPFIGLGVFKSKDFIFSIRVQRDNIAAYEFDMSYQEYALGWIQMRKLYLVGVDYSSYESKMEWKDLKLQPGVISFADDNDNKFNEFYTEDPKTVISRSCQNIESYIGHLKSPSDKKLLYWFNKYKFEYFYGKDVVISEIGVCTDNGLVMRYEIKNNSGKTLKLISKDKDIGEKMHFKASNDPGTETSIPSSKEPVTVNWYQLFKENIEPTTVNWNDASNFMSFTFEGDTYSIEQPAKYHIVKCNGTIILAGNHHSFRKDTITHRDTSGKTITFERDPNTLMFLPQKN
ncbi:uncharacterized protein LOC130677520 [Microplitis mediator]|uniref:uncharacterized protein LOC130677520 n=1 Tax=Microplitis mediator TaxID=375433 RepID=UPI002553E8A4|nr:uncharacterized protein LOC130677520 [Microplitis mediator]